MTMPKQASYAEHLVKFHASYNPVPSGCWEWKKSTFLSGYGAIRWEGKAELAHRVSWLIHTGSIASLWVLHRCDNRRCVNPQHLFLGTGADNNRDMFQKNRWKKKKDQSGEHNPWSKLTQVQAEEIRSIYASGGVSMKKLGKRFGVSNNAICMIVNRRTYAS